MTGTALTLDNLQQVLILQLHDLLSAEEQLIKALPKMAEAADASALKQAFQTHLRETRIHKKRLEEGFQLLNLEAKPETCEAMKGLIAEGEEIINLEGEREVKDAALIAAAQRVEHYEIAGYGCARSFALRLGNKNLAKVLQQTLNEEVHADTLLTQIAEESVNTRAVAAN